MLCAFNVVAGYFVVARERRAGKLSAHIFNVVPHLAKTLADGGWYGSDGRLTANTHYRLWLQFSYGALVVRCCPLITKFWIFQSRFVNNIQYCFRMFRSNT